MGLRLFLSDRGVIKLSRPQVVVEGKKYLDDLYAAKTLQPPPPGEFSEVRFQGWGGLGIHEHNTPEYQELFDYLLKTSQRAVEDTYPAKAINLLAEMQEDVQRFYRRLVAANSSENIYASVPVLAKLDPDEFVDAVLALHPSEQHIVMMMFKSRYDFNQLDRNLKEERPWAKEVRDKFIARAATLSPMGRYRAEKHIEWYLKAVTEAP
jgi:hypothetical protein